MEQENNTNGAGTIVWWSLKGSVSVEAINKALEKRGLEQFAKLCSTKHAFSRAWKKFGSARHDNYIPRLVLKKKIDKNYREVIGLIHEDHEKSGEKLTHNQYAELIYISDKDVDPKVVYRCSCGEIITATVSMLKCDRCNSEIPSLARKITESYIDLSTNLGSMERAGQVGDYARKTGIISLSGGGRPFYTPDNIRVDKDNPTSEHKKGMVELFLDAVKEWGDTSHCLPLKIEAMSEVQEFSFLHIKSELDSLVEEIDQWSDATRASTKRKRLERLFAVNDKINLYERVLGSSEKLLKEVIGNLEEKINNEINFKKKE